MASGTVVSSPGPHCAIGRVLYADGAQGLLLYFKSSVTGDEKDYILDYKRRNPTFPHETTADQFFTEEQFEAYRALGFHILKSNEPEGIVAALRACGVLDGRVAPRG